MFKVEFSVRPENCWACEISEKFPNMLMQVTAFNGVTGVGVWRGEDAGELIRALRLARSCGSLSSLKPLLWRGGALINEAMCKCPAENRLHLRVSRHDCFYLFPNPIHFVGGEKHCRILATNHRKLRGLLDEVEEKVGKVTLREASKVSDMEGFRYSDLHEIASKVSPKQLEALRRAKDEGYYHYPRKANLTRMARKMGISKTTYHMHLRKGENKILQAIIKHL